MIVPNKVNITYTAVTPNGKTARGSAESNEVNTEILSYAVPKTISCNKTCVRVGETFHKCVTVTNKSSVKIFNNLFTIPKPDGASFVAGSVKINGVLQPSFNPTAGFPLPDLNTGESLIIEFDLKADERLSATPITTLATLNYTLTDPARGNVSYSENTDILSVNVIANNASKITYSKLVYVCDCDCPYYSCDNRCDHCDCCNCNRCRNNRCG